MQAAYTIQELADRADVTPRTVRYYIRQGLLPGAAATGPGAHYDQGHLDRLRLIKDLQRRHLPLAEIRRRLEALSEAEMRSLLAAPEPRVAESALYYVRAVLSDGAPAPPMMRAPPASADRGPDRSQWERHALTPDIELHVRRPLDYWQNGIFNRILEAAREILIKEKP